MKKINHINNIIAIALAGFLALGCSEEFLDFVPPGAVGDEDLNSVTNVEKMVIAAYAGVGNDHHWAQFNHLWVYGGIRGHDAHKGGGGVGDVGEWHNAEIFSGNRPDNNWINLFWLEGSRPISRANEALRRVKQLTTAEYPLQTQRIAELRFLRGHLEFVFKIMWKNIVYIDENVAKSEIIDISNRVLTSDEGWNYIADEFRAGVAALPDVQADEGRPTKNAARAYLAKTLLYKAYRQDDNHQVVSIDATELQEVVDLVTTIEGTGEYALTSDFAENFLWEFESGEESVWAVMRSTDDGSADGRGNFSDMLQYNMGPGYGCCWFEIPTDNLTNAFKTDANGLPLFDTYNIGTLDVAADVLNLSMDARFGHTVVLQGMPFKYEPSRIFDRTYLRAFAIYGDKGGLKDQILPESPGFRQVGPFFTSSKNTDIIRYGDVLMWKAEALIELGRMDEALPYINMIRARAANSTGRLVYADGTPTAAYNTGLYTTLGTQDNARKILQWERRLEFAWEGVRFFDLVRWGIAGPTIAEYAVVEKVRKDFLAELLFTVGRDEYNPIPTAQIVISQALYVQNPGYN